MLRRRALLTELMRRIVDCSVVVITLGLSEAFYDHELELVLNTTPARGARGRVSFCVLSYEESLEALESAHDLLRERGHPEVQIVVTVSPVPLEATFRAEDIVVANAYPKACLRTVAEAWSQRHENVHYFPSYEIVTSSSRDSVWSMDGRHVRDEAVEHVVRIFTDAYVEEQDGGPR
jgi:hypothetical protein